MLLSPEKLADLRVKHDDKKKIEKTETITFQEAYKRCKRYITLRDEEMKTGVTLSYQDKKRLTLEMIDDFVNTLDRRVDGFLDDLEGLKKALKDEIVNYGILTDMVDPNNEEIDEVQVNSLTEIFYVENGIQKRLDKTFSSNAEVKKIIEKLIEKGERLNATTPFINGRTGEGFRINVTHTSINPKGCYGLTLRKQKKKRIDEKDLLRNGSLTENMLKLMKLFSKGRVNWATVGATGSGKTVLNNVLVPFIDPSLRCIYIENPTELRPEQYDKNGRIINNFLQLEAKSIDNPKPTDPTMYNLLVNALRQTPDYIIPGEVRAPEEFEVALAAAQTGHNVFTTFHAEDPDDAIRRFLNAVQKVSSSPAELIMMDICAAFRFVINVKRYRDGKRRVKYISEVYEPNGLKINTKPLYEYVVDKVIEVMDEETGRPKPIYIGRYVRQNAISPWFQKKLKEAGIPREQFEFFTTDPEKLRDEDGELILDELGEPIVLEREPEYQRDPEINRYLDEKIERAKALHKKKKEQQAKNQWRGYSAD